MSKIRALPLIENPVNIPDTAYSYQLFDKKGRLLGRQFSRATAFLLFYKKKKIWAKAKSFVAKAKLSSDDKLSLIFQFMDQAEAKRRLKKLTALIKIEKEQIALLTKQLTKKRTARQEKKFNRLYDKIDEKLYRLKKRRAGYRAIAQSKPLVLPFKTLKKVLRKDLFSLSQHREIRIGFVDFKHFPVKVNVRNIPFILRKLKTLHQKEIQKILELLKISQRDVMFRLVYQYRYDGHIRVRAAGGQRRLKLPINKIPTFLDENYDYIDKKLFSDTKSYFRKGLIPLELDITGFTLEYIEEKGRQLKGSTLTTRAKLWEQEKAIYGKKKRRNRQISQAEKRARLSKRSKKKLKRKKKRVKR